MTCAFATLLRHPASPLRHFIVSGIRRRLALWGATGGGEQIQAHLGGFQCFWIPSSESVVPSRGCIRPRPTLWTVFLMFHGNASQCLPSLTHRFVLRFLIRSKSTSNETDATVLELSAVGVESPSFLSHLTSSRCVYVCAPFLVFRISRFFPDIMVTNQYGDTTAV